jgi:hypothetical protein
MDQNELDGKVTEQIGVCNCDFESVIVVGHSTFNMQHLTFNIQQFEIAIHLFKFYISCFDCLRINIQIQISNAKCEVRNLPY